MTAAALWPSGLLVFLTPSLTDCLDLIGKDSLAPEKAAFSHQTGPITLNHPTSAGSRLMWEANYF